MKEATLKITTGAMFIAIFTILLIMNRYSGGFFEEFFLYILPIPMVAYSAKFGFKAGVPVVIAMTLMSVFFGTITTIFYAFTEACIGLAFGTCVKNKMDSGKTMGIVMLLSTIANVLNTIVLASLFGYNVAEEVSEMQSMFMEVLQNLRESGQLQEAQLAAYEQMFSLQSILRLYIIAMILLGIIQGFLIYELSLLILNRLHFQIAKPKPVYRYFPPRLLGGLAAVLVAVYIATYQTFAEEDVGVIIQTVGLCAFTFLVVFGFIAVMLASESYLKSGRIVALLMGILVYMILPYGEVLMGVLYLCTDLHARMLQVYDIRLEERGRKR